MYSLDGCWSSKRRSRTSSHSQDWSSIMAASILTRAQSHHVYHQCLLLVLLEQEVVLSCLGHPLARPLPPEVHRLHRPLHPREHLRMTMPRTIGRLMKLLRAYCLVLKCPERTTYRYHRHHLVYPTTTHSTPTTTHTPTSTMTPMRPRSIYSTTMKTPTMSHSRPPPPQSRRLPPTPSPTTPSTPPSSSSPPT